MKKVLCLIIAMVMIVSASVVGASAVGGYGEDYLRLGDINMDETVDIRDATVIQKRIAGMEKNLSQLQLMAADTDEDRFLSIKDATMLQKHLAGVVGESRIGEFVDDKGDFVDESDIPAEPEVTEPVVSEDYYEPDEYTASAIQKIEERFLYYVNNERKSQGLCELSVNEYLDKVTDIRSKELTVLFGHTRPDGTSWHTLVDTDEYYYSGMAENCAHSIRWGDYSVNVPDEEEIDAVAEITFKAFKKSEGHYRNMMGDFRETGISVSFVIKHGVTHVYVEQIFGTSFY